MKNNECNKCNESSSDVLKMSYQGCYVVATRLKSRIRDFLLVQEFFDEDSKASIIKTPVFVEDIRDILNYIEAYNFVKAADEPTVSSRTVQSANDARSKEATSSSSVSSVVRGLFIGKCSRGFYTGHVYNLSISVTTDGSIIQAQDLENGDHCKYSSFSAFLHDWRILD